MAIFNCDHRIFYRGLTYDACIVAINIIVMLKFIKYFVLGLVFGIILVKTEVISWFRIQEMFRFQSFHMYGVIGSAILVGALSLFLMKKMKVKTLAGEEVRYPTKSYHKGLFIGGFTFGLGWTLTGACPGPIFALIGSGYSAYIIVFLSALLGTWTYGYFRNKLPH